MKYKNSIEGFPREVVGKMLEEQVKQGSKKDVSVFENSSHASRNDNQEE